MTLITKKKAAELLDVSERTVDRYAAEGRLTKRKKRGDSQRAPVRFDRDEVLALFVEINAPATVTRVPLDELESCGRA